MKKKIINIISIVILVLIVVLSFVGKVSAFWPAGTATVDGGTYSWGAGSFSFTAFDTIKNSPLYWVFFVFAVGINLILCLTSLFSKRKGKDPIIHVIFPTLLFVPWITIIDFFAYNDMMTQTVSPIISGTSSYNVFRMEFYDIIKNNSTNYVENNTIRTLGFIVVGLWFVYIMLCFLKRSTIVIGTEPTYQTVINSRNSSTQSNIPDELNKYKQLLDDGVITQKEFDAKKKQLLGL